MIFIFYTIKPKIRILKEPVVGSPTYHTSNQTTTNFYERSKHSQSMESDSEKVWATIPPRSKRKGGERQQPLRPAGSERGSCHGGVHSSGRHPPTRPPSPSKPPAKPTRHPPPATRHPPGKREAKSRANWVRRGNPNAPAAAEGGGE